MNETEIRRIAEVLSDGPILDYLSDSSYSAFKGKYLVGYGYGGWVVSRRDGTQSTVVLTLDLARDLVVQWEYP